MALKDAAGWRFDIRRVRAIVRSAVCGKNHTDERRTAMPRTDACIGRARREPTSVFWRRAAV